MDSRCAKKWVSQESFIAFAIHRGHLAGPIGLARMVVRNKRGELTYWIGKDFVGKGIVTKASLAILQHAFASFGFYRVDAYCAVENVRSRAVAERLGLKQEGIVRGHSQFQGKPLDHVLYSIVEPEWREKQQTK